MLEHAFSSLATFVADLDRRTRQDREGNLMRLLGLSGSLSQGMPHQLPGREVLDWAGQEPDVEMDLLEIVTSGIVLCDDRPPERSTGETRRVIDKVVAADTYVVGSPMYRGSYTGAFKNLFDLLPNDTLTGNVVGLVATGGGDHHFLAPEHQLRHRQLNAFTCPCRCLGPEQARHLP